METQLGLPAVMMRFSFLHGSDGNQTIPPPPRLETCCNAVDLLTVSFFSPTEISSKNSWSLTGPGALAT